MSGDVRIMGSGNGLVFADGSVQTTAAVPATPTSLSIGTVTTGSPGTGASATITGAPPSQVLNLVIPQGTPGQGATPSPCSSIKMVWTHQTVLTTFSQVGATPFNTISEVRNMYDSVGNATGWIQTGVNGNTNGTTTTGSSAAYYTAFDSHGGPTEGYVVGTPGSNFRIAASYTYDSNGKRTQRVRTWYSPDGSTYRVQTTNYGQNMAYLSETSTVNGSTTTTTYSNTLFDSNNLPYKSDFLAANASGAVVSSGKMLYGWTPYCIQ